MSAFLELFAGISEQRWLPHGLIAILNVALFVAARPISRMFDDGRNTDFQGGLLRVLAYLLLLATLTDLLLAILLPDYHQFFIRLGLSLLPIYGAIFLFNVISWASRRRFGVQRIIDESTVYLDTYNSRLMDIFAFVLVVLVGLYALIKIWQLDSLLETTGILGVIFAFLALTNQIWAPDLYYGMVILNSQMLDDGDTIRLERDPYLYIINKVTFIYTTLLNVQNNHRTVIRNSRLINVTVENLTKRASVDGLRESLVFNIGYPPVARGNGASGGNGGNGGNAGRQDDAVRQGNGEQDGHEARHASEIVQGHRARVDALFTAAHEAALAQGDLAINPNPGFEWAMTNSGDHAVEYTLWYYLRALPNTKVTRTVRQHVFRTAFEINRIVLEQSQRLGVELATPLLVDASNAARGWPADTSPAASATAAGAASSVRA